MVELYEQYGCILGNLQRLYDELSKVVSKSDARLRLIKDEIYELEDDLYMMRSYVNERRLNNETSSNV